jgi:hypothetical protein
MPDEVVARFDFETDERGVAVNAGRECHLAKDAWLLAESPEQELDYALLRLVERAGDDPVHSAMRGFITPKAEPLKSGEPLLILQHPSAEPLKLSIGSIQDAHAPDQRLLYTANTKGGSSGSPCMNMALETVALHHFGAQQHNRGVLWSGIEADLRARGLWQFIG